MLKIIIEKDDARVFSGMFLRALHVLPHLFSRQFYGVVLLLSPFYSPGTKLEKGYSLSKFTWVVARRAATWNHPGRPKLGLCCSAVLIVAFFFFLNVNAESFNFQNKRMLLGKLHFCHIKKFLQWTFHSWKESTISNRTHVTVLIHNLPAD